MMDDGGLQRLDVLDAGDFRVVQGVARGEPLGFADELVPDDTYRLDGAARRRALDLRPLPGSGFRVESGALDGRPGRTVHLDSCLTLMAPGGETVEAIVLVEVEGAAAVAVYLLPLGRLVPGESFRLVGIDRHAGTERLARLACISFTRGTHVARADGTQAAVEDLRVGDHILTRDGGAQPLRRIGRTTLRASGSFAPVLIRAGALNNARDLRLSPDHRIFVWQREDRLGAGRAELLVRVRDLVDGRDVLRCEGGFVDYVQLVFDAPQIVYAEGIGAESSLPERHGDPARYRAYGICEQLLSGADAVALLRRASAP